MRELISQRIGFNYIYLNKFVTRQIGINFLIRYESSVFTASARNLKKRCTVIFLKQK